jgi:Rieske Fe-S protein
MYFIRGDTWHAVASVEQLGTEPIRFTTNTIIGYVMRQIENGTPTDQIIAFSGVSTRSGCIVQWQQKTRQFISPCDECVFDDKGIPVYPKGDESQYLPLPRLETTIENGIIYVKVPA